MGLASESGDEATASFDIRFEILERFDAVGDLRIVRGTDISPALSAAFGLRCVEVPVFFVFRRDRNEPTVGRELGCEAVVQAALDEFRIECLV